MEAKKIEIKGVVQGVGFRPFVYRIAYENNIKGWVLNNSQGVFIHAQGNSELVNSFVTQLLNNPPRQAIIKEYTIKSTNLMDYNGFSIIESSPGGEQEVLISPDLAICPECSQEVLNQKDRRYRYPFSNCTNCGPRFTIIQGVPYDRGKTTMSNFPMCKECSEEYHNPLNRRFHAQPNACHTCGPENFLLDKSGQIVKSKTSQEVLREGKILAIKGLGGYHLACDAKNYKSVSRLRNSKKREFKPFAVMAKDIGVANKYCEINKTEETLLSGAQAPIVILKRKSGKLPVQLAPGLKTLGVMLPYTPLHILLFNGSLELLVMTSGNISDHPLVYKDQEAFSELAEIADYFYLHNREIYNRCDDSVLKLIYNKPSFIRRARGYVPLPVDIPDQEELFACGGDLKSTFCLTKGKKAFLSQHMGDLDNFENLKEYITTANRMQQYLAVSPKAIVVDLHPHYNSRHWGIEQGLPLIEVQHHHAHFVSCLVDNKLDELTLGVICDGTGYGTDGNIWGMEFILGDYLDFTRLAHLEYIPLPGGEKAVKEPQRIALSYLYKHFGEPGVVEAQNLLGFDSEQLRLIMQQIDHQINCPLTSSCGRLFDAVSSIIGVCTSVNYEGQAAIELEEVADEGYSKDNYSFDLHRDKEAGPIVINTAKMWQEIIADISRGMKNSEISAKFHRTVVEMIISVCLQVRDQLPSNKVALSGGVMQNKLLLENLVVALKANNFEPILHGQVPANDGGLSLGQGVIGGRRLATCV